MKKLFLILVLFLCGFTFEEMFELPSIERKYSEMEYAFFKSGVQNFDGCILWAFGNAKTELDRLNYWNYYHCPPFRKLGYFEYYQIGLQCPY